MNRMFRRYGLASLLAVVAAAALLFFFVRKVSLEDAVELAERSNAAFAQSVLALVKDDLVAFLQSANMAAVKAGPFTPPRLPAPLAQSINRLMSNPALVRLKIYDAAGVVIFSTRFDQLGEGSEGNGGFESAMAGVVVSSLTYRHGVNPYEQQPENDNVIQTYIPVRRSATEPIVGVFEIYTDANVLVARNDRARLYLLAGVGSILALLYLGLLYLARRAAARIQREQERERQRTAVLERLSAYMLGNEEEEKRRLALELHEGLAQTLCSIKVLLEAAERSEGRVIGILQSAIDDARNIASRLRPSSLDELGLAAALAWLCDGFERGHPELRLERQIALAEDELPAPLNIVLYRVVEAALANIARPGAGGRVDLGLRLEGEAIVLGISHSPTGASYLTRGEEALALGFAKVQEQVALSGGSLEVKRNGAGGVSLRASWPRR